MYTCAVVVDKTCFSLTNMYIKGLFPRTTMSKHRVHILYSDNAPDKLTHIYALNYNFSPVNNRCTHAHTYIVNKYNLFFVCYVHAKM